MKITIVSKAEYFRFCDSPQIIRAIEPSEDEYDRFYDEIAEACSEYGPVATSGDSSSEPGHFSMYRFVPISSGINVLVYGIDVSESFIAKMKNFISRQPLGYSVSFDFIVNDNDYSLIFTSDSIVAGYKTANAETLLNEVLLNS